MANKVDKKENINSSEKVFRKVVPSWYPGHMAKTRKQIIEDLKLIDIVIIILDSRIPVSSQNPDIAEITKNKDKIIVLNKSDLADKKENDLWVQYFKKNGQTAILADCNTGKGINEALEKVEKLKESELEEYAKKGRVGKKIRAMVLRYSKCR